MTENIKAGDYIFVYGTLRRGERADLAREQHHFSCSFVGEDRINGNIYDLGPFPGAKVEPRLLFDADLPTVVGDLFVADDASIGLLLDHYEGYPYMYNRVETATEGGRIAWVYVYCDPIPDTKLIPSGDWKQRLVTIVNRQG